MSAPGENIVDFTLARARHADRLAHREARPRDFYWLMPGVGATLLRFGHAEPIATTVPTRGLR